MSEERAGEHAPLVTVRCITYNHEPYIRQCLEGFVMQKTTFPFEAIVHDDASTDGTAAIIREFAERYPDIIKPIYETENQYSKRDGSLRRIMDAHTRGKYIAYCEGDDYWVDPLKLQTQVDFLESHPDYGMCYCRARIFIQKKNKFLRKLSGRDLKDMEDLLFNHTRYTITTASVVLRKDLYFDYVNEINPGEKKWLMGDTPLWLYMLKKTKAKLIQKDMIVHRILEVSAAHFNNADDLLAFRKSEVDMRNAFIRMYTDKEELPFDEHKIRAWFMAPRKEYTRLDVLGEISKALSLEKRDKLLIKICKSPFLFFLARLRWELIT